MALGEYVAVSSQRDSERAQLAQEQRELSQDPDWEFAELAKIYQAKGLSLAVSSRTVAGELTANDPLAAHADAGVPPECCPTESARGEPRPARGLPTSGTGTARRISGGPSRRDAVRLLCGDSF
jgi:hypothetical protein